MTYSISYNKVLYEWFINKLYYPPSPREVDNGIYV